MSYLYASRMGSQWVLFRMWDDDGLQRRSLLASSPDPRAIEAAFRLLRSES